ncbi:MULTISPECIES: bifunctional UDP-sugar hydrolase/5'-nucleotidase UshA [Vibrio]|uniref:bifunctional UDP-sugar hydrolase/5'-nucleotidase UshA n=1 Tax=Vibrio TaxID=662 RepID=UPI0002D26737|nr:MULTISPECIES: bifunctional UDP-sugar hydrolase/5'-nucleotidase UshA [Vibrio]MBE8555805.1 bifunctional UDP-sugar hydrolase/5'-nucleotidase [Vibrio sp. OPT24]MDH5879405.1 bifunctional UDP-sugar hydrolase/5'-nucleotidase UshA [Vibrio sp. S/42/10]NOH20784.1 bifunctional UDP-sugar hydrolase/5'-nucleotidase [Vibrio cyclitrophicus]OBT06412.1 bifunctional UDP-sugar hydrolase/5'-nucleotidase [Vibrio cyclitrophicus]OEE04597.1 bifunctional UDP-sugar hydrolase/5'-nucleotidase [Vibrio cyclitrophicus ZF2|tara:strand:- start:64 stop:1764 length:1701 start_codon:yes stop_codon:yes gene_type:complete
MNFTKSLLVLSIGIAMVGCGSDSDDITVTCDTAASCTKFTVLHTNDNHGRFWENSKGEYGMAARKTLIDSIRAEVTQNGGETILLSGGDINTGVPESDMQDAVPDFVGMNLLGYDAMALGNHEFDNSLDVLDMQAELADFPMLAANIYIKDGDTVTDERLFSPYKVFTINGLKVAVIGLTTKDTAKLVNPDNVATIHFADPQVEIKKAIKEIEANETVDLIFATTHMGHYADGQHGSEAPGDVLLARSLEEGQLDAIIGGHSQNPVCMEGNEYADFNPGDDCKPDQQNGTYIMQAHEWGKYVGRADFEFYDGKLHLAKYDLIPVNLKEKDENGDYQFIQSEIEPNSTVIATLSAYQQQGQELLDVIISKTDAKLEGDRNVVRSEQTNLGHLLGEAYRTYKLVNADFGVMNSGGVRDSIAAGDIAYRDVLTVQPFGNFVTKATMTGAEVKAYLDVVATMTAGSGAYAQLDNISLTVDCDLSDVTIRDINGKGFDLADTYTFSVISFSAAGGDDYPIIDVDSTQLTDAAVLREFFVNNPNVTAAQYAPADGDLIYMSNGLEVKGCPAN